MPDGDGEMEVLRSVVGLDTEGPHMEGPCLLSGLLEMAVDCGGVEVMEGLRAFLTPGALILASLPTTVGFRMTLAAEVPLEGLKVTPEDTAMAGMGGRFGLLLERATGTSALYAASAVERRQWVAALERAMAKLQQTAADSTAGGEEGEGEDSSWLLDVPDELDVLVTQRAFERAAQLAARALETLEGRHVPGRGAATLRAAVLRAVDTLAAALCQELQRSALRDHGIATAVRQLVRVGKPQLALRMYLENRTAAIRELYRKVKMEASTEMYVNKLSRLFVEALRAAAITFGRLFQDGAKSAFVLWLHGEVEHYAGVFSQHVLAVSTAHFRTIAECVSTAVAQSRGLRQLGIDAEFLLWEQLGPSTVTAVEKFGRSWLSTTAHQLEDDAWTPQTFSGKHARKKFLERLRAAGVEAPEAHVKGLRTDLFEAITEFCVSAHGYAQCGMQLLGTSAAGPGICARPTPADRPARRFATGGGERGQMAGSGVSRGHVGAG